MSPDEERAAAAAVFAALGDPTRLAIVGRLATGEALPIAELTAPSGLTRQAVRKHLEVLEAAALVSSRRFGRERRFQLRPEAITPADEVIQHVRARWDAAIGRLRRHVESQEPGARP